MKRSFTMKFIWQVFILDDYAIMALSSENSRFRLVGNPEKSVRQTWLIGQKSEKEVHENRTPCRDQLSSSKVQAGAMLREHYYMWGGLIIFQFPGSISTQDWRDCVCVSHRGCAANHFRAGEAPTPSSWSTQKVRDGAMAQ